MPSYFYPAGLLLVAFSTFTATTSAETVLGAYIFARHGDRTAKATPPAKLTDLGYNQTYSTGKYYHDRYISDSSPLHILAIDPAIVNAKQLKASAPSDEVLQNSATGFLQGLYPPAGNTATSTLRDGTTVEAPLDGYQLIALKQVSTGSNSENEAWLQSSSNCHKAKVSSDNYFSSEEYKSTLDSTKGFYQSLTPMLDRTFDESKINYKNAYTIFDYLNVANIHNNSFPADNLLTTEVYDQLLQLASDHEYNLAYNESDPIRAVSGSVLAGEIHTALQETISSGGAKTKLNVQFGAYATFLSFFGLSQLSKQEQFAGIPDYASSMAFELVTNATVSDSSLPETSDINVRFLFQNGSLAPGKDPSPYPLFGKSENLLSWSDFESEMKKISLSSQEEWCKACGNTTGTCASSIGDPSATSTDDNTGKHGMSKAVAGVVGAMVTLGVVLGLEALVMLIGGLRLVKKPKALPSQTEIPKAEA